jgi:hypothetical protein
MVRETVPFVGGGTRAGPTAAAGATPVSGPLCADGASSLA